MVEIRNRSRKIRTSKRGTVGTASISNSIKSSFAFSRTRRYSSHEYLRKVESIHVQSHCPDCFRRERVQYRVATRNEKKKETLQTHERANN